MPALWARALGFTYAESCHCPHSAVITAADRSLHAGLFVRGRRLNLHRSFHAINVTKRTLRGRLALCTARASAGTVQRMYTMHSRLLYGVIQYLPHLCV